MFLMPAFEAQHSPGVVHGLQHAGSHVQGHRNSLTVNPDLKERKPGGPGHTPDVLPARLQDAETIPVWSVLPELILLRVWAEADDIAIHENGCG